MERQATNEKGTRCNVKVYCGGFQYRRPRASHVSDLWRVAADLPQFVSKSNVGACHVRYRGDVLGAYLRLSIQECRPVRRGRDRLSGGVPGYPAYGGLRGDPLGTNTRTDQHGRDRQVHDLRLYRRNRPTCRACLYPPRDRPEIAEQINVGVARGEVVSQAISNAAKTIEAEKQELSQAIYNDIVSQVKRDLGMMEVTGTPFERKEYQAAPLPVMWARQEDAAATDRPLSGFSQWLNNLSDKARQARTRAEAINSQLKAMIEPEAEAPQESPEQSQ